MEKELDVSQDSAKSATGFGDGKLSLKSIGNFPGMLINSARNKGITKLPGILIKSARSSVGSAFSS